MEYYAISSLETDIVIEPEIEFTQSFINVINNGTISIDNRYNMERSPIITLTLNGDSGNIVITNQTTLASITIVKDPVYSSGTIFTIYNDAVYVVSEISAIYSGIFNLKENAINVIQISTGEGNTVDLNVTWKYPSGSQQIVGYAQGFSINSIVSQQKKQVNKLKKYTNGYIDLDISYDFVIDHLYFKNYFPSQNIGTTYRIKYFTDSSIGGIQQQTMYLSGVSINTWGISQEEVSLVKENIRGVACRLIQG